MKRQTKTAAEVDVVYTRGVYCYLDRPGVSARIKRQMRCRERREGKQETRQPLDSTSTT